MSHFCARAFELFLSLSIMFSPFPILKQLVVAAAFCYVCCAWCVHCAGTWSRTRSDLLPLASTLA